ncbi:DUF5691 domain-containing protein [Actinomyces viscosus]|uniref:Uncharacterized protein n=1 Tax=Actinomyces viscosus TaxID=1656 RepID=A0A448PM98_ACTVI|nr:DUF5691 domain-containing protein [Actinomyces viscosus]VEI17024.1 Uncharacterised protein [Actinomyces viscosus]
MSDLSPLAQAAVLGTSTRPFSPSALPGAVASTLPPRQRGSQDADRTSDAQNGTDALLDAGAAYGAVHRAMIPQAPSARDTGWATSSRPLAPKALCSALEQILVSKPQQQLLATALELVTERGWRLPAPLLVRVLNEAAYKHENRDVVLGIIDERAAAVLRAHPVWGKRVEPLVDLLSHGPGNAPGGASGSTGDDSVWRLGTTTQRLTYFKQLRAQDPVAARALLVAGWDREKAEARQGIVEALATNLSEADLPLLEMALTDRSAGVRQAAAKVLLHLPESGLVQRAEALAASHMNVTKRFLRTTRVDCRPIEVTEEILRDEYDERNTGDPARADVGPASARRAAAGYPPGLLEEVVGRVPVDRWPALIGLSARRLLEAEVTFDGKPLDLREALFTADRRSSGALIEACTADAFKRGDVDTFTDMRRYWRKPYCAKHSRRMVSYLRSTLGSHRIEDIGYWASQEAAGLPVSCHAEVLPEALSMMEAVRDSGSTASVVTDTVEGLRLRLQLEALREPAPLIRVPSPAASIAYPLHCPPHRPPTSPAPEETP